MRKKIALGVLSILLIIVAYNLITQIIYALKSGDRLNLAAESLIKLQSANRTLKQRLEQVKSPDFIEKEARDKLGMAKNGETIVIIPPDKINSVLGASVSAFPTRLPNWLGWWKVFF